jgi:N-methylhydantoinase B
VVKGVMRQMIRDCSEAVGKRLQQIPDGEWAEYVFTAGVGPTDREAHRELTRVRKIGDRLICSNEGSDPQSMAGNSTFSSWRSALISAVSALLASDQMYCPGGVVEHMDFRPTPGTRNVARHPAAISALTSTLVSVNVAYLVIGKMLLSGPPELARAANAAGGFSTPGWWVGMGLDRQGQFVADTTADAVFGAIGAFRHRDGVDTGGAWWFPRPLAANAEEWESALPILYLYRREKRGSGGAGRQRGGNGAEIAIVGHKTASFDVQIVSADPAVNASHGLAGGLPGHSGDHLYASSTAIQDQLADGHLPRDGRSLADAVGGFTRVGPKSRNRLLPEDVLVIGFCAGGGIGDPLERPPAAVLQDCLEGAIGAARAEAQWGVVVRGETIDGPETETRRRAVLQHRLRAPAAAQTMPLRARSASATVRAVAPGLHAVEEGDGRFWGCEACDRLLAPLDTNVRLGLLCETRHLQDIDPDNYPKVSDFCDADVVGRSYYCPACASQISFDVCLRHDDHFWDTRLF